jgi:hypothetical protein
MLYVSEYARRHLLPGPRKDKPYKLTTARRQRLVGAAVAVLSSGYPTKFVYEGAVRTGVRRQLCLDGWPWADADSAAAGVVETALRRVGAKRPTWKEGQPAYTEDGFAPIERTRCIHCSGPIPEGRRASALYCSVMCKNRFNADRTRKHGESVSKAEYLAQRAAQAKATREYEKQCENCGQMYRPVTNVNRRRFCGKACQWAFNADYTRQLRCEAAE